MFLPLDRQKEREREREREREGGGNSSFGEGNLKNRTDSKDLEGKTSVLESD
jgi:hypothetical protein